MPRVKLFNQDEALEKAMELFWEKGYASTSLSDLITHLNISKGSFYDTFKSKRALYDQAIDQYRKSNLEMLKQVLASEKDVQKGIRKLFEFTVNTMFSDKKRKGCLVANSCSELGGRDAEIQTMLTENNKEVYTVINNYLQSGNLKNAPDLDHLTNLIITQLSGINLEAKFKKNKQEMLRSSEIIINLIR